ncbi:MAG: YesL family protein [Lachnospiraceae bacterium]|nr:YesL family protein [Lachnospiraceae bacterium]
MRFSFSMDSGIWKAMEFVYKMIIINLLFVLTCLPIFTIGASVSAMAQFQFHVIEKREETDGIAKQYFSAFKENFKNSTILWLIYLAFLVVVGLNILLVYNTNPPNRVMIMVCLGIALFFLTMVMMYGLAMQGRFVNSLRDMIVKAFWIGLSGLPYTIVIVLMILACLVVTFISTMTIFVTLPIWILLGFYAVGYLCNLMYLRVFRKYTAQEDLPEKEEVIQREVYMSGDRRMTARKRAKEKKREEKQLQKEARKQQKKELSK